MALLERVTLLIKANLNDLIDQAENPEKLLKQLLLDMQNQFMQVKTQLAAAIASQHLLQRNERGNREAHKEWLRKAELAIAKNEDGLARQAAERALTHESALANFAQQIVDQSAQVQTLRESLHRLEQKMTETRAKADLLLAQHRKARLVARADQAAKSTAHDDILERARDKVRQAQTAEVIASVAPDASQEQRFTSLENSDRIEAILEGLREKQKRAS